jgi:ATP-binding cassette, subfamily B, multidrug efflux pump
MSTFEAPESPGINCERKIIVIFRLSKKRAGFKCQFIVRSLKHINKYFYKYRLRLLLGVFFVAISNLFGVYSVTYGGTAIDFLKNLASGKEHSDDPYSQLLFLAFMILLMALVSGFFLFLTRQTIIVMSRLIEYDLKNEIYEHYQQLDVAFYKRNNTGDLMNRISEDVSRVRMYIGPAIMYIVNTLITFALTIYVMAGMNPKLTLYVLAPLPVLAISIYYVSNAINKKSTRVQEQLSAITTSTQEAFSGIRILKAYGREAFSTAEFEKESSEYRKRTMGLVKTESLFQPFMILLIGLSTIFTIYIGGKEIIGSQNPDGTVSFTYGNLAQFVIYVARLTWPIASLGWVTSLIQRAAASQTRINEFLHTRPDIKSTDTAEIPVSGSIEFRDVSFVYPDSGTRALDHVSFSIPAGSSLAIVGPTGSGKSTIANLICRLYDVTEGGLLIDGKDIRNHPLEYLRSQTGYVPQEVFLFSDTIARNIAFSVDVDKQSQKTIEQAAKDAAIYSNIMEFPEKFETLVGERGITLSGGQKQRVSIARAIIKKPRILLFDDCLSAVDTETEEEILNNLKRVMQGKTSIIISHRVSSVKNAGNIIVLQQGRIVEQGSHQQLLSLGGTYANLHKMQLLEEENTAREAN